jgi:alpha-ribazole phosphatase
MEIFLVRHLEIPSYNKGLCVGQSDVPLTDEGMAKLEPFAESLLKYEPQIIITSDLQRCKMLADRLGQKNNLPFEESIEWREVNFGRWENQEWDEIKKTDPDRVKQWVEDYVNVAPPDGESFMMLFKRIGNQLLELTSRKEERAMVITHSGAIRASLCYVLGVKLEDAFSLEIGYGCTVGLRYINKHWSLFKLDNPV